MHEVHYLTLAVEKGRRGWIAPAELLTETDQAATCAIPIDSSGTSFTQYRLGFVKYLGQGRSTTHSSILHLQPSGFFKALIDGQIVQFQLRVSGGKPVIFEYVGDLTHADFQLPLAEIVPESEQQLDDLYSNDKIVVVGCDPACYGGIHAIKQ